MGAAAVPEWMKAAVREVFKRTLILCGGYDAMRAESDLLAGKCDPVAFERAVCCQSGFGCAMEIRRRGGCARHRHVRSISSSLTLA